jgi:hypothetical protein
MNTADLALLKLAAILEMGIQQNENHKDFLIAAQSAVAEQKAAMGAIPKSEAAEALPR